jgi:hypothetical protein
MPFKLTVDAFLEEAKNAAGWAAKIVGTIRDPSGAVIPGRSTNITPGPE